MAYPMTPTMNPSVICRKLPLFGEAMRQAQQNYQAPDRLCLMSCLAAMSSASQSLINVVMPYHENVPVSLALLIIARSGERKSAVERRMMKVIREVDDHLEVEHKRNVVDYKFRLSLWKKEKKKLEKCLASTELTADEREQLEDELRKHLWEEPVKPCRARFVHEDTSPIAMLTALNESGAGTLISSEGGIIVNGRSFDAVPYFNSIWSGDSVSVERAGRPALQINGARLTISIMLQPEIFEPLAGKKGEKIRGSGHFARYIIAYPVSTQGFRFSRIQANSWEHLDAFDARIRDILGRARMARVVGEYDKEEIRFSLEAATEWFAIADQIEENIRPGGRYERASDHASKLAENIARVAALLHYFEGFEGDIDVDTLHIAADICMESSRDYLSLFAPPPQRVTDAAELKKAVFRMRERGLRFIRRTYLSQRLPYAQRGKQARFLEALDVLLEEGVVKAFLDNRNAECLDLSPYLPPQGGIASAYSASNTMIGGLLFRPD